MNSKGTSRSMDNNTSPFSTMISNFADKNITDIIEESDDFSFLIPQYDEAIPDFPHFVPQYDDFSLDISPFIPQYDTMSINIYEEKT